jgi:hypothetical protein
MVQCGSSNGDSYMAMLIKRKADYRSERHPLVQEMCIKCRKEVAKLRVTLPLMGVCLIRFGMRA